MLTDRASERSEACAVLLREQKRRGEIQDMPWKIRYLGRYVLGNGVKKDSVIDPDDA